MKNILIILGVLAAVAMLAPAAAADNDCCWDWNPNPGAFDKVGTNGPLPPGPPRPGAPFGWAQCTKNGGGVINCFVRQGRQAFLPNWRCDLGSLDPNGNPPPGPGASGFTCTRKSAPPDIVTLVAIDKVLPPGVSASALSYEGVSIPTVSEWGLIVLSALLMGGGMWIMRRRSAPTPA